jgi:catechol 2,3-dioxygenase-like lactoylglutathione lyase family enzyme
MIVLKAIEELVGRYERGGITRRDLVTALSALFLTPSASLAQRDAAPVRVRTLNHVSISVADVDRSVQFYQSIFGLSVKSKEGTAGNPVAGGGGLVVNLAPGLGPEFIGIYHADKAEIGHFCLGVENFNAEQTLKALTDRGVKARMRTRGESKEIFLTDPDNISVQLTDTSYCGGSGPFGNKCSGN